MVAPGIAAMALCGCVRRHVEGDVTTYATEPWAIAATAIGAVAAVVAGWYIRRKKKWRGYLLLGGGVLVLCTTVPGLSMSRTLVDPDHVEWNRGFLRYSFRFDDLARIDHTIRKTPIGRTIQDVHHLDYIRKTGEATHIQVEPGSNRYLQDAIPEILRRARDRGVQCTETEPA
jgi:hypothetical protein